MPKFARAALVVVMLVPIAFSQPRAPEVRPRARDLGLAPGVFQPGTLNAITDVPEVTVGHITLIEGDGVRTGVTAILPHSGNLFQEKVTGAVFVGNAFGRPYSKQPRRRYTTPCCARPHSPATGRRPMPFLSTASAPS